MTNRDDTLAFGAAPMTPGDARYAELAAENERLRTELGLERTLRGQVEDEVRQLRASDSTEALLAPFTHEFNNMVTIIAAHADVLAGRLEVSHPLRPSVDSIRDAVGRAARTVRRLMAAVRPSPPDADPQPPAPAHPEPHGTETILLVENEAPVRALIRDILRMAGYVVLEARSGEEALNVSDAHASGIDVVIADVIMPGIAGRALIERLTASRPSIKSLYVSGYGEDLIRQHGVGPEPVKFLPKPFTVEALIRKVREVLDA